MPLTQAFFCPPSCIRLILTVAWFGALSRVCLHAYLHRLLLVFLFHRICALYVAIVSPSPMDGLSFPPCGNAYTEAP